MNPIYLPLVLSLATPLPAEQHPTAAPTRTVVASETPQATASPRPPHPLTATPTITHPPLTPDPTSDVTATAGAGASATPTPGLEWGQPVALTPVATRISKGAGAGGTTQWTMWVDYTHDAPRAVGRPRLKGTMYDARGTALGEREASANATARKFAAVGEHGCFMVSFNTPAEARRFEWTMTGETLRATPVAVSAQVGRSTIADGTLQVWATSDITRSTQITLLALMRNADGHAVWCGRSSADVVDPALEHRFRIGYVDDLPGGQLVRDLWFVRSSTLDQ